MIAALACGPAALRPTDTARTLSLGGTGGATRRVETLTDLEEVRAVVVHAGFVYVGTDNGLFRYPERDVTLEVIDGLPGDDIRGITEEGDGLLVVVGDHLVHYENGAVTSVAASPPIGDIIDVDRTSDGTVWLCGLGGLARRQEGGEWEIFGEPARCVTLAPTPEGQLWVGTTQGLWYVDGDVVREHPISGGIPEAYVRAIVPVLPGQVMAILQGPNDAYICHYDGERWYSYTILGLDEQVVGMVRRGGQVLLISEHRVLVLAPRGDGVPLVPLGSEIATVRSYRARIEPASEHEAGQLPDRDVLEEPRRLAERPDNMPAVEAPSFLALALDVDMHGRAYGAFVQGPSAFIAIANGGVLELSPEGPPRPLLSRTLVPESDLHIATDPSGTVWMLSRERHLAKLVNGRLRRVRLPEGNHAQALADGPQGAYLIATTDTPNTVRVFTNSGSGWTQIAERTLEVPTRLTSVPFAGVAPDGKIWIAIEIEREQGEGNRVRGAVVIDPSGEGVVYHHRGADREAGGLPLPDEISAIDFDTDNAWFASLSGLVRVGSSQAVVFGEARGVRGEVVSDAVVGSDVIWLASAEGLGSYDRSSFNFVSQPDHIHSARPHRLAMDLAGHLWMTSNRGLILHEGTEWVILDADAGLPTTDLVDVEVDEGGRVWILAADRVLLLTR